MPTLDDISRHVLPPGTRLLTSLGGLDREVQWAVAARPRTPVFDHVGAGYLACVSLRTLGQLSEEVDLAELVQNLGNLGVAGVAIMGDIQPNVVQAAAATDLPLFHLPDGVSVTDVTNQCLRYISEQRQQLLEWSQEVDRQFTELAIEGRGVNAIATRLGELTGCGVVVEDSSFRVRARERANGKGDGPYPSSVLRERAAAVREWLRGRDLRPTDPPLQQFEQTDSTLAVAVSQVVAPIVVQGRAAGYASLLAPHDPAPTTTGQAAPPSLIFSQRQRLALSRAAAALAIEWAREIAISQIEDRYQANILDEVLDGTYTSAEAVQDRARRLGYNLSLPYTVAVFSFHNQPTNGRYGVESPTQQPGDALTLTDAMARDLQRITENEAGRRQLNALVRTREDRLVILFSAGKDQTAAESKKIAAQFRERIANYYADLNVSGGIGRYYPGVEGLSASYGEAEKAMALGLRLFGAVALTYFGDLGVYRLLLGISQTKELHEFYEEVLGKLIEHDTRNNGELITTLHAYFKYQSSPSKMAEGMSLHRNTLLYRLRRIEEIAGVDLEDAETRLALQLALRIGEVLGDKLS